MYLVFIFLFVFLSWCVHFYWTRRRLFCLSWNVPGPLNLPFIGIGYLTLRGNGVDAGQTLMNMLDTYPKLNKFWIGPELFYMTSQPEYAKILLNSAGAMEKFVLIEYLALFIGDGLLTQPASVWKRHRKIIAPTMSQNILNTYPKAIGEQCLVLLEKLGSCVGKGEIDPCAYITNCSFDIIGKTLFDFNINAQANEETYSKDIEKSLAVVFLRMSRLLYHFNSIFTRSKDYKTLIEFKHKILNIAKQIVESSRQKDDNPFLSLMHGKQGTNQLTDKKIEAEIYLFLLAGTDTSAVAMCWLLTMLAIHQDIQQKVYEEVMEVVASDVIIDLDTLNRLDYTKRVIKESLRIFPIIPLIGRFLDEDIAFDKLVIPKGANVVVSLMHLHRNADYWPEPLKFDPDRFLPENSINRHPYAWIPFGGGPRNCIGYKHALMTMRIMTAMITRKFKVMTSLKSIDEIDYYSTVVVKPVEGFKLTFQLR